MVDYTLCYRWEDGKFHIGKNCTEVQEKFVGEVTEETVEIPGCVGDGCHLALENLTFATSADIALALPGGTVLTLKGENRLKVKNASAGANVGVLYSSGDLTIEGGEEDSLTLSADTADGLWSRAVCARAGDLTINGGVITAVGGNAKKSCGLYAGGRLWIEIGEKGVIALNGGKITAWGKPNAVRAAEGKLLLGPGAQVSNAKETGSFVQKGDCLAGDSLTAEDAGSPVVVRFA